MTEETLKKAIEIKRKIDGLRAKKTEVEKVREWSRDGKTNFSIQACESGFHRDNTQISTEAAKMVLDKEIEIIEKELETLLNELSELN